jgi:hypothetical protein
MLVIVADCPVAQPAVSSIQFGLIVSFQTAAGVPGIFALFCGAWGRLGKALWRGVGGIGVGQRRL